MIKLIGNINNIGNKAFNIYKLACFGFQIPYTFIITTDNLLNFDFNKLNKKKKYIVRPSFFNEDGKVNSNAGKYNSIYPLKYNEIISFFSSKNYLKKFGGNEELLLSVIIQEFIETNIYGVIFSRDPQSINKKPKIEIGNSNFQITKNGIKENIKINLLLRLELYYLILKIEKKFNFPQDVEFCVNNSDVIFLQARNITSLPCENFSEVRKITGFYYKVDNGEFGNSDFIYEILKLLNIDIFILGNNIYFKQSLGFLFKFFFKKIRINYLNKFLSKYKKYLLFKLFYSIVRKILFFQKLDLNLISSLYFDYSYNFDINKLGKLNFDYNKYVKCNLVTKILIKSEKLKNIAFLELEKIKKEKKINIRISSDENIVYPNKVFIFRGIVLNNIKDIGFDWIYKGKIKGNITYLNDLNNDINNQVLLVKDMDFDLLGIYKNISGVIIEKGGFLSHNSILLRELKIPSIINYKDCGKLKNGQNIYLK